MCGIFGYVGRKTNAPKIILDGLKTLEYRGYDSWGIAAKPNSKSKTKNPELQIEKHVGKIGDAKITSSFFKISASLAIGHTRWATHGGVTQLNAHPHLDCLGKIAVLHNGIIENFQELKKDLIKKGHKFISETDTEVAAHLIEENLKRRNFTASVLAAFNKFHGMNAIVVINNNENKIIAAKNGSPLVIGKTNNEFFIASDASGIIKHTNNLLFLKDNEMAILEKDIRLFSLPKGNNIKPVFEKVDWKQEISEKGKFKHFMHKEIFEQPKVIRNIAKNYEGQILDLAQAVRKAYGTFFIAAGTAYHACLSGVYLFAKIARRHANTAIASEFNYLEDFLNEKSLVIALSQSGETIDVIEPLNRARGKGAKIIGITNTLGSTIYRMADKKILLSAGPEKAVASTKAYIAKLSILVYLSYVLSNASFNIKKLLLETADETERLLDKKNLREIKKLADLMATKEHIYAIGRGASYPTALEAALKIKEVSYIHTEGLAGGELKHGTIALIEKGTPAIVFAPLDDTYEAIISNATEIKSRGGYIIGISPKNSSVFDYWIELKDLGSATIISQIVPAQLLAYFLAVKKGFDPDKPRNLAKSVTVK